MGIGLARVRMVQLESAVSDDHFGTTFSVFPGRCCWAMSTSKITDRTYKKKRAVPFDYLTFKLSRNELLFLACLIYSDLLGFTWN